MLARLPVFRAREVGPELVCWLAQMHRRIATLAVLVIASGCSHSATAPSTAGVALDLSGAWTGTFSSSNNPAESIGVSLAQSGANVTGTWKGASLSWAGDVTGAVSGSSLNGTLTFSGGTTDGVTCTGSATYSGSFTGTSILLTSASGVIGDACPAPLPSGIQIDLHR